MEFACSPSACVGFLWVLRFIPTPEPCARDVSGRVYIAPVRGSGVRARVRSAVEAPPAGGGSCLAPRAFGRPQT